MRRGVQGSGRLEREPQTWMSDPHRTGDHEHVLARAGARDSLIAAADGRILVIATQRIGDVLLATPLIRSLRRAVPRAHIAALVYADTAPMLAANRDVDAVLSVARRPSLREHLLFLARLWRRYDLAFSTGSGDRPTLYACIAARRRVGVVSGGLKHWWKRTLLDRWALLDDGNTHTVLTNLRLADLAGVARSHDVVTQWTPRDEALVQATVSQHCAYAVLHLQPKFAYKAWHTAGWVALGKWLDARGLQLVLTGSADPDELAVLDRVMPLLPAGSLNVAGRFTLAQVACLLSRARLFVGPDTVITHMAAALGTPTIALFGPSNPMKWGPWPRDHRLDRSPFAMKGSQQVGNVFLVQGDGACVPCMQEGCERHIHSTSACLQRLGAAQVVSAAHDLLKETFPRPARELGPR